MISSRRGSRPRCMSVFLVTERLAPPRSKVVEALRFVGKIVINGNEFPIGTRDFTWPCFRRELAAAELACKLGEPESAHRKIFKQSTEGMDNIRRGD